MIVNDGSSDNSEEVALAYCNNDNRIKYFVKENGGSASSRNIGLKNAVGDYIQFLDADDFLYPEKFALSIEMFELDKNISVVVTDFKMFSSDINEPQKAFCTLKQDYLNAETVLFGWDNYFSIPIHCGLFRAELFKGFSFNEELRAKEDWLMWISIFLKVDKGYYLEKPLALYRDHANSKTKNSQIMNENINKVYRYLLNVLPKEFNIKFSDFIIDRLSVQNIALENELKLEKENNKRILDSESFKIGNRLVNIYHKILFKK